MLRIEQERRKLLEIGIEEQQVDRKSSKILNRRTEEFNGIVWATVLTVDARVKAGDQSGAGSNISSSEMMTVGNMTLVTEVMRSSKHLNMF